MFDYRSAWSKVDSSGAALLPVDVTVNMSTEHDETLVLGETWTGDHPIVSSRR